jgi:hypothetical protein
MNSHPHLVLRLIMSRAKPFLSICACMACHGEAFTFDTAKVNIAKWRRGKININSFLVNTYQPIYCNTIGVIKCVYLERWETAYVSRKEAINVNSTRKEKQKLIYRQFNQWKIKFSQTHKPIAVTQRSKHLRIGVAVLGSSPIQYMLKRTVSPFCHETKSYEALQTNHKPQDTSQSFREQGGDPVHRTPL